MTLFIKKILFPILIFFSVLVLTLRIAIKPSHTVDNNYTLKAYKNTVALYNGENLIKTYDNIILNTLPQKDIYNFKAGIPVTSPKYAENYLEDFDS